MLVLLKLSNSLTKLTNPPLGGLFYAKKHAKHKLSVIVISINFYGK
ncbi:hypothetical protein LM500704_110453 [Listeria monocytogenes]|nr:hypothetical protein LM500704_110453 [Listeria monocytogenes]CUM00106.1 hypothetical protein LM900402_130454 [Listeria monocytogenes]